MDAALVADGEVYCVLNELKAYDPASFPYADEAALSTALATFYASSEYLASQALASSSFTK